MSQDENNKKHKNVNLKIIGVGGAGNNAINLLLNENYSNVELYVANTDFQDLEQSQCPNKIYLGKKTDGYGAGGNPEVGEAAANESIREIESVLKDTDLLIISAGLGGGTGTGAAPVIAQAARDAGIMTLAIVTTPFETFEGAKRKKISDQGLQQIAKTCDSYIVLSNEKLALGYDTVDITQAFLLANVTLKNTIKTIRDIIFENFDINIDFNDLRKMLKNGNQSFLGVGKSSGEKAAQKAVESALLNQLNEYELSDPEKIMILFKVQNSTFKEINDARKKIDELLGVKSDDIEVFLGIQNIKTDDKRDKSFEVNIFATNLNHTNLAQKSSDLVVKKNHSEILEIDNLEEDDEEVLNEMTDNFNLINEQAFSEDQNNLNFDEEYKEIEQSEPVNKSGFTNFFKKRKKS